jgi:SAM-dependent methyltransferase
MTNEMLQHADSILVHLVSGWIGDLHDGFVIGRRAIHVDRAGTTQAVSARVENPAETWKLTFSVHETSRGFAARAPHCNVIPIAGRRLECPMHAMEMINRGTWSTPLSLRGYRGIHGYIDAGEKRVFELAFMRFRGGRFLDIGVGGGRTAALIAGNAGVYLGIDYTAEMVEIARANHPDLDFRLMDARNMHALDDRSQDIAVFSYNGIDSVDPQGRLTVLSEVSRVLAPGGAFVFSTFHRDWDGFRHRPSCTGVVPPSANPLLLGLRYCRYLAGVLKAQQRRRHEVRGGEHAILLHHAHYFGIMVYATVIEQINSQLADAGFATPVTIFDEYGAEVSGQASTQTQYFHVFAEKPAWS